MPGLFEIILSQRRNSRKKVHSIHEPEVQCISKGKEHKKYEFGNKVSIMRPVTGIILGAMSFRNEYDGHAMESFSEQVERLTGRKTKLPVGDRGIQGQEGNQRDEDYDSRCTREIRQLLSEAEKT